MADTPQPPARAKAVMRWGGYALLIAALVYCGQALRELGMDALVERLSPAAWLVTIATGLAYGAALALLAAGWAAMAARKGALDLANVLAIYGPAVVAKYIPGSVFQYGSRQLTGAEFGLEQKPMVRASLAEAGLHIPAALLCAAILLVGGGAPALGLLAAGGLAVGFVAGAPLWRAAGFQLCFFALFALLAVALAALAVSAGDPERLAAMFMLAWVAGFLVPVAPGGIGVRETALLALAVPDESAAIVAAFALLTRLATTIGDAAIGCAGYGLLLSRRWNRQASA
ncbi:hypothetical protein [Erythrobacter sp. JK5]|uniref:hypothetical protein n=1 Tax=Erythrobacter sp. JK5 TaxID=2829500 RepID=UPI001BA4C143|nr:hypothetical protein [Erythrobacter sp. JK5]QUL36434.1 hypothetical protein KDC96_08205 [Erythrobacter sp. JK5]